jgi:DNA invertase Pin-like site-specific DNA recombinase
LEPVTNPAAAIRDARSRGVTVAEIADALGIAHQTVYARYGDQISRRKKTSQMNKGTRIRRPNTISALL